MAISLNMFEKLIAIQHGSRSKSSVMTEFSIKPHSPCSIEWNSLSAQEWDAHYFTVPRANLLQSRDYGDAVAAMNYQRVQRGLIMLGGRPAGMVQILEAGLLGNTVHGIILDRGPLWFKGYGSTEDFLQFVRVFRAQYPKRIGRRMRFIPEIQRSREVYQILQAHGFTGKGDGYQTFWVDMRPSLEEMRKRLHGNWRNKLNRAEKSGLQVSWDDLGLSRAWLMGRYAYDQQARQYKGASVKLLDALAKQFLRGKKMLIGTALLDNSPIAAILVFIHGSSATYQVGFTSAAGRDTCAHHLLLWNALAVLKERSVYDFDLGGVNDESAQGVKAFKQGLGGQLIETPGLYT